MISVIRSGGGWRVVTYRSDGGIVVDEATVYEDLVRGLRLFNAGWRELLFCKQALGSEGWH